MSKTARKLYNYNLSHNCNTTVQMGKLIPVGCFATLPGDIFKINTSAFIRMSPMAKPVMHPIKAEIRAFYVPDRIIWDDLEDFHTGGDQGMEKPVPPFKTQNSVNSRGILDYYGIPVGDYTVSPLKYSMLPFRGYNKIWNYFFRDQDLQPELEISTVSGFDSETAQTLQRVSWTKDYFTVARPWAQKGPSVSLNIGDISLSGDASHNHTFNRSVSSSSPAWSPSTTNGDLRMNDTANLLKMNNSLSTDFTVTGEAGAVNIADLRFAFQMQSYLEQLSRMGSRYDDVLRSVYGVKIRNEFIQEPVYIGGSKQTIQISEVVQTSGDGLGNLGGHGIGTSASGYHTYRAPEFGYIHILMYIRPDTVYMQNLNRHWSKTIREDYYNPFFALVGQQEILNKELNAFHNEPDGVFGYADRYDEYRDIPSINTGEFRTLEKDWHLARELPTDVALNSSFISCVPSNRIFLEQSGDYDHFQCMVYNKIQALRPVIRNPRPRLGM